PGLYSGGLSGGLHLPALKLDHLYRLTDSTGIMQHARYHLPFYEEGYCTDDNARALILTLLLKDSGVQDRRVDQLADTYMAFINYAYSNEHRQFRNFMSYDRRWLEEVGSEDSTGRTIWALGMCIGRSDEHNPLVWAMSLLEQVLPATLNMQSPRTWAFALLGIHEYLKRFSDDRLAKNIRTKLVDKLMFRFSETAASDWQWFEDTVAYDNGVLAHALIVSGNPEAIAVGLKALVWLMELQTSKQESVTQKTAAPTDSRTHFQPIGSNGFHSRGMRRAEFDQQPLEAYSSISACLAAWRVTGDPDWQRRAIRVFRWFTGLNDLGLPLYDPHTGGCRDGLHIDRANQNQGAESTLAYLLSLAELQLAFQPVIEKSITRSRVSALS
ncbi:MAG TPA: glycosyl transferase family 1, partial [Fibrella sp.]